MRILMTFVMLFALAVSVEAQVSTKELQKVGRELDAIDNEMGALRVMRIANTLRTIWVTEQYLSFVEVTTVLRAAQDPLDIRTLEAMSDEGKHFKSSIAMLQKDREEYERLVVLLEERMKKLDRQLNRLR